MSMSVGSGKGGPVSEINVTPLVDIMLVLLIIMMLIAPLLQKGVDVNLPTADNVVDKPDTQQQTVVHVTANKSSTSTTCRSTPRDLVDRIRYALEEKKEKVVYLKADAGRPLRRGDDDDGPAPRSADRERRPDHRDAAQAR